MLDVKTANVEKVINHKHAYADPFQASGRIHPKDNHEPNQLEKQRGLQNAIITEKSDVLSTICVLFHVLSDELACCINSDSLLESKVHYRHASHQETCVSAHIRAFDRLGGALSVFSVLYFADLFLVFSEKPPLIVEVLLGDHLRSNCLMD